MFEESRAARQNNDSDFTHFFYSDDFFVQWKYRRSANAVQTESVSLSSLKKTNQNDGHDGKWYGSLIDKALGKWNSTPEVMMQEIAKRAGTLCSGAPLHSQEACPEVRKAEKVQFTTEMQMNTIVSVCQLSIYSPVMTWYLGRRGEGDTVSPYTNLNNAQNLMTNFTRHETPDLCDLASIIRPRS